MARRKLACKKCVTVFTTDSAKRRLCYKCDPKPKQDEPTIPSHGKKWKEPTLGTEAKGFDKLEAALKKEK